MERPDRAAAGKAVFGEMAPRLRGRRPPAFLRNRTGRAVEPISALENTGRKILAYSLLDKGLAGRPQ